jgi:hypothetical protein
VKVKTLLFGLVAGCASGPAYPLCDLGGAPACGNIGQTGRQAPPTTAPGGPVAGPTASTPVETGEPPPVEPAPAAPAAPVPAPVRVLLGASARNEGSAVITRPLLGAQQEPVCGNVMGKGSRRRVCRVGNEVVSVEDVE